MVKTISNIDSFNFEMNHLNQNSSFPKNIQSTPLSNIHKAIYSLGDRPVPFKKKASLGKLETTKQHLASGILKVREKGTLLQETRKNQVIHLMNQVEDKLAAKNIPGALKIIDKILELDPKHSDAIAKKIEIVNLQKVFAGFLINQIECELNNRNFKDAYIQLNHLIELDPKNSYAFAKRGEIFRLGNLLEQAKTDFDLALCLDPTNPFALSQRGALLHALGKKEKALDDVKQALSLQPSDDFAMAIYADLLFQQSQTENAFANFALEMSLREEAKAIANQAIKLNQKNAFAYVVLSQIMKAEGDEKSEEAYLNQAFSLYKQDPRRMHTPRFNILLQIIN